MARLVVELLGGLRVTTAAGRVVRISSRKAQAVLACLALRPSMSISRDQLAGLLWEESDPELARASLRQALATLRRSLPAEVIAALVTDTSSIALDPALAASDVQRFRELVREGSQRALVEAAEHHAAELLHGFEARSAAFDAWVEEQRRGLRREWSQALQRAAAQCTAAGDHAGATDALSRLVAVEPSNETAQRDLMELYARQGLYTDALRQYRICAEALRRDLDVAPDPATESLHRDILRRRRAGSATVDELAGRGAGADPESAAAGVSRSEGPGVTAAAVATLRDVVVLVARIGRGHGAASDDPETLRDYWALAETRVRDVVTSLGGVADRPSQGEIVAVFGLPMVTGNEVDRALRAAERLTAPTPSAGDPRLAVGVARGLVLPAAEESPFPITGQPVAVAHDLARGTSPGSVGVAADIAALSADAGRGRKFAGRRAELAMLETLFERVASAGRGRAVVVRGEPGIGKSSLLEALAATVRERRATVVVVNALDFGQPTHERPGPALARQLLGVAPSASADDCRAEIERCVHTGVLEPGDEAAAADLSSLEPTGGFAPLLAAMDPAARERARARILAKLLAYAAAQRPALVIVEDAHWADAAEIAQLGDLAGAIATLPVLLALSTRVDGDPFTAAWRARARGCPVTTLDLAPLADDEARELAGHYRGLAGDVLARCLETAGGNPLFLVQLLRNAQAGETALPGSVRALLLARVERLPQEARRLVHAAAVLGVRFSIDAMRHVAAAPASDRTAVEELGLLACDGDECRFSHALIRAAVYEALLRSTRKALHQRAAQWFEGRDPALHAEHLAAAEDPAAVPAHLRAAVLEQRACRFDRALWHAERARVLAGRDEDRCEALAAIGAIHLARGRTEEAVAAYDAGIELARSAAERARSRLGLATALRVLDRYEEALEVLRLAERDAIDDGDPRQLARVWTLRGNLHFPRGELERCLRAHERALELAREASSAEDIARALGGLGDAHYQRGRMRTALDHMLRCLELSEQHGLLALSMAYRPMAACCRSYCGEFEPAIELARLAAAAAQRMGDLRAELLSLSIRASTEICRSQYATALSCSERSIDLARQLGARRFEAEGMVLSGRALCGLGRREEGLATLEGAVSLARDVAATYCGPWAVAALAYACGDEARGRVLLAEGEELLQRGSISHNHLEYRMLAIEFLLDTGDAAGVLRHAAALSDYTQEEPLQWADLVIARARALAESGRGRRSSTGQDRLRGVLSQVEAMGFEALAPRLRAASGIPG